MNKLSLCILLVFAMTACSSPVEKTGPPKVTIVDNATDSNSTIVKGYADKITIGMTKADVEKITKLNGNPKENNAPHEQVFHYDFDGSFIQVIYSVNFENNSFTVLKKKLYIDNLAIKQRNKKRSEAFARWVQQRKDIMNKKRETEKKSPNK